MLNNNRPISSYHRSENNKATINPEENLVKSEKYSNKNIKETENNLEIQQSVRPTNNNISSLTNKISDLSPEKSGKKKENVDIDYKIILERFNEFLKKNKIKKEDFIESEDLFLNKEDFKDCFKKLRFDLSKEEANFLFHYNNQYSTNDFIRMKNFLELFPLEFMEFKTESVEAVREDMKKINEDFKNLHVEIFDIIKNDIEENRLENNLKEIGKMKKRKKITNIYDKDKDKDNKKGNKNVNNKSSTNSNFYKKNPSDTRPKSSSYKINANKENDISNKNISENQSQSYKCQYSEEAIDLNVTTNQVVKEREKEKELEEKEKILKEKEKEK